MRVDAVYEDMNIKRDSKKGTFVIANSDKNTMKDIVGMLNDTQDLIKVGGIKREKGLGRLSKISAALMDKARREKAEGISMWSTSADEYMVNSLDGLFPKMSDYDKGMMYANMYNDMSKRGLDPRSDTEEARRVADDVMKSYVKDYMKQKHPQAIGKEANRIIDEERGNKALGEFLSAYDMDADPNYGLKFNQGGYEVEEINGKFYNVLRSPTGQIVDKSEVL